MDDVELTENDDQSEMLLGVHVQSDLKWHKHVNYLLNKLQTRLNALERLRYILPFTQKKSIVQGIFTSVLSYYLPVFAGCDQFELDSLQRMQNKAARIISNSSIRDSRSQIFKEVGWMTVRQLAYYRTALCMYRIKINQEPEYLFRLMDRSNRFGKVIVPNTRLSLAMNSFCFRGATQWNKLPAVLRQSPTLVIFKKQLKKWIYDNVHQSASE